MMYTHVFWQLAERDAMHQAELAQVRIAVTSEVEGAYLRCLEKMVDRDSGEGVVSTKVSESAAKKSSSPMEVKRTSRRVPAGERFQPTKQPRKTTK